MYCFSISSIALRVRLDTAENWKLKLKVKTEKHYRKIIFKCVNSTVRPIFNKKVTENWNLWIRKQCTICTDWLKRVRKVKLCGYCSWTVAISLTNACKKKKKARHRRTGFSAQSKRTIRVVFMSKIMQWSSRILE